MIGKFFIRVSNPFFRKTAKRRSVMQFRLTWQGQFQNSNPKVRYCILHSHDFVLIIFSESDPKIHRIVETKKQWELTVLSRLAQSV